MRIDLVWLVRPNEQAESIEPVSWPLGSVHNAAATAQGVRDLLPQLATQPAAGVLFWHADLGPPNADAAARTFAGRGDLWHLGLLLGQAGRPASFDFVHPTWMLHRDPEPDLEASSWRLSLRACLLRRSVLEVFVTQGGPPDGYDSFDAAALELGHRCYTAGVLMRSAPQLAPGATLQSQLPFSAADELLFIRRRVSKNWMTWAAGRGVATARWRPAEAWRAWRRACRSATPERPDAQCSAPATSATPATSAEAEAEVDLILDDARVTVLIPTLDRYDYLLPLLEQLGEQTAPPFQVIVIDQTVLERRRRDWHDAFPELDLTVIERDQAGQCSSRNAGLRAARGDYVLFLDDDDEVDADLIVRHLECLRRSGADVICGVADEAGAGPLPAEFRQRRLSDVFPTNNAMVRRQALAASGLFDLAYEKGARADADLGMRLYLSGALLVLEPSISVFHHHAPAGGLRQHKARAVTYASSRQRILHRHLPSLTECYLAARYFTPRQVREARLLRIFGTFALRGNKLRRLLKIAIAFVLLPNTWLKVRRTERNAAEHLQRYPEIPTLEDSESPTASI